jgi:ribosomal protein S18 acetylase RimI-like enzyme
MDAMNFPAIAFHVGVDAATETFLAERIYEFNAQATGYFDGESFSATYRNKGNGIVAGICGYTWGGCCYINYLWVSEQARGSGLGRRLMEATEAHARARRCVAIFVGTHNFQAPGFYEGLGFEPQAFLRDHPVGHGSVVFAKRLHADAPAVV